MSHLPGQAHKSTRWGRARHRSLTVGTISVAAVLVIFEALSRLEILPSRFIPPIDIVIREFVRLLASSDLWNEVAQTLEAWAIGLGLAVVLAVPIGLIVASSWTLTHATRPVIEFLRPIPSVALIPLAVLTLGTGTSMAVFLVSFASFWPVVVQTMYGVRDVDPILISTGRTFGWGRARRMRSIVLPSILPYVATGIRVSSAFALILAITAELIVGSGGLGGGITLAQTGGALSLMYALIIATGLLAMLINSILQAIERHLLSWHPSHRPGTSAS